jgi:hypothetical protein
MDYLSRHLIKFLVLFCFTTAFAYDPPAGIPDPATVLGHEIDIATPNWPASWLTGTTTATAGYYFIEPDHPSATNSSNPYGHPDLPRANLPHTTEFDAGDFVWLKGGTYVYATGSGLPNPGNWDLYCVATSENPLWIIGDPDDRPDFRTAVDVGGYGAADHIIIRNLDLTNGGAIEIRPRSGDGRTHQAKNILIQDCYLRGVQSNPEAGGIGMGGGYTGDGIRDFDVENVIIHECDIADYGIWDAGIENDICAIYKAERSKGTWVLNSLIQHVGGDGIAGSAFADGGRKKSEDYWIGGNIIGSCGENNIDLKGVVRVVISNNILTGPHGSQQGGAAIFHTGGDGWLTSKVWCIFNTVHSTSGAFSWGGSPANNPPVDVLSVSDEGGGECLLTLETNGSVGMYVGQILTLSDMSVSGYNGSRTVTEVPSADAVKVSMIFSADSTGTADQPLHPNQVLAGCVGNVIYNNHGGTYGVQQDNNTGFAAVFNSMDGPYYFVDNSVYDFEVGAMSSTVAGSELYSRGNIFWSKSAPTNTGSSSINDEFYTETGLTLDSDYNRVSSSATWNYNSADRNLAYMQGTVGIELNTTAGDPLFVNAAGGNLNLQSGSPCISASIVAEEAYDAFEDEFGIDIRAVDRAGNVRPLDSTRDLGAYEFVSGGGGGTGVNSNTINASTLNIND